VSVALLGFEGYRADARQDKGYEPEALLNFLGLMGWDHHAARPSTAAEHPRSDSNSLSELFTMDEMISAFDLTHVNHRKSAVTLPKLDFLNKMTLRQKAGRLGDDGNLKEVVHGHEASRRDLVTRLQTLLREVKVLQGR
jgi:glutamyl-tRNA synthetase